MENYLQNKSQCKDKSISHKIYLFFLLFNACETSYINIYVDLLSITLTDSVFFHDGVMATIRS